VTTRAALGLDILPYLPHLRAFARFLARDDAQAQDLVQDAVMRALSKAHLFVPGTNLKAWLTIILRNGFYNDLRRKGRRPEVSIEVVGDTTSAPGEQEAALRLRDFQRGFARLTAKQREALLLVGASGFSYQDAADIARCAVGTMKSRVSRARSELERLMAGEI
jgi:RNA polymerase sigma-70 factor (ECF subfamily)